MSGEYFELKIDENLDEYSLSKLKKKSMKYGYLVNKCAALNVRCIPTLQKFYNKKNPINVLNHNNEIKKIIGDHGISLQLQMFDSEDQKLHKTQMYIDAQEQQLLEKYGIRCVFSDIKASSRLLKNSRGKTQHSTLNSNQLMVSQGYDQDDQICAQIQQQLIEWFNRKRTTEERKLIKPQSYLSQTIKNGFLEEQQNNLQQQLNRNSNNFELREMRNQSRKTSHKDKIHEKTQHQPKDHISELNNTIKQKNIDQNNVFTDPLYNNQLNANQRIYGFGGLSAEEIKYRFSMKRLDVLKRNIKKLHTNMPPFNSYRCIFLQLIAEMLQYKNQQIQLLLIKGNSTAYYQKLDSVWPDLIINLNYQFNTQLPKSFPYFKKRYTILPRVPTDDPFIRDKVYKDAMTLQSSLTNTFQADIDNFIIEMVSAGYLDTKKQYGFRILEYFQQIKPQLPNALNNQQGFVHAHVSQRQSEQLTQDDVKRYLVCYSEVLFYMQNQQFVQLFDNDSKHNFETKKEQLQHQFTQKDVIELAFYLGQYLEQLFYGPLQNILQQLKDTNLENNILQQKIKQAMKQSQQNFMENKCEHLIQQITTSWDKVRSQACQNANQMIKQSKQNNSKRNSLTMQQTNDILGDMQITNFSVQETANLTDLMKMYKEEDKQDVVIDLNQIIEGVSAAAIKANEEKYPYLINSHLGRSYESTFLALVYELLDVDIHNV